MRKATICKTSLPKETTTEHRVLRRSCPPLNEMKRAATLRAGVAIRTPLVRGRWRREEFCVTMQMIEKQIAMAERRVG